MAKNKGKMGKDRVAPDAPPDEFVSTMSKVAEKLRPHALKLGVLVGALAIALIAFSVWRWHNHRQDSRATALYEQAVLVSQVPVVGPGDVAPPTRDGELRDLPDSFASSKERAEAALVLLDKLDREYGKTRAAHESRLLAGSLDIEVGKFDAAATAYGAYAETAADPALVLAAREGIGYALEAKALAETDAATRQSGLESALKAFEALQPDDAGPGRSLALYHQGRVLAALARNDDAVARFKAAKDKKPGPALAADIDARLTALDAND